MHWANLVKENKRAVYRNLGSRLWGSKLTTKQSDLLGCTSQIKPHTQHSTDMLPPQTTTYKEKRERDHFTVFAELWNTFYLYFYFRTMITLLKSKSNCFRHLQKKKWEMRKRWCFENCCLPSYESSKLYSKLNYVYKD